jgi:hypothetical protein
MSASRPWRVYVLNYGRDYMWGTYETKECADEVAQGLCDRGENASVRAFKRVRVARSPSGKERGE